MNMISPEKYRRFDRSLDRRIVESFQRFCVHTCEQEVTPYVDVLLDLLKMGYLDMGMIRDMSKVRSHFSETRRAALDSTVRLYHTSLDRIWLDMERIYRELGLCHLVIADVRRTAPDRRVNELLAIRAEIAARPAQEAGGEHDSC